MGSQEPKDPVLRLPWRLYISNWGLGEVLFKSDLLVVVFEVALLIRWQTEQTLFQYLFLFISLIDLKVL